MKVYTVTHLAIFKHNKYGKELRCPSTWDKLVIHHDLFNFNLAWGSRNILIFFFFFCILELMFHSQLSCKQTKEIKYQVLFWGKGRKKIPFGVQPWKDVLRRSIWWQLWDNVLIFSIKTCGYHNIVKITEILNSWNYLETCLQSTYPVDFCIICSHFYYGKKWKY